MSDDARLIYGEWDGLEPSEQLAFDERLADEPELREARAQAQALRADLRALGPRGPAMVIPPLDLERLEASAPPPSATRLLPALAAAAVVLLGIGGWWALSGSQPAPSGALEAPSIAATDPPAVRPGVVPRDPAAQPDDDIAVAFRLAAPEADAVAVAGDFNDWKPEVLSMQRADDGLWTAQTALPPGRYAYMYVVDGKWITPPDARRTQDDGFGARNGVLDLLEPFDA